MWYNTEAENIDRVTPHRLEAEFLPREPPARWSLCAGPSSSPPVRGRGGPLGATRPTSPEAASETGRRPIGSPIPSAPQVGVIESCEGAEVADADDDDDERGPGRRGVPRAEYRR